MILLEKLVFYVLVFCLPFQTRKILYQWGGSFNEWTSAYLYLTDILIILLFLFWAWRIRKQRFLVLRQVQDIIKNHGFWLVVFLLICLSSLVQARNFQLSFYQWFKLLEFVGLFFYLKHCVILRPKAEESISYSTGSFANAQDDRMKIKFKRLAQIFVASGLFQSIIALGQYINQKDLGLRLLTESPLRIGISGVAKIIVDDLKFIRPYGGLPHPNLLAVFLFTSIFFLYWLWLRKEHSLNKNYFFFFIFGILFFTLCFTFSRIIIAVFVIVSFVYFIFIFKQSLQDKNRKLSRKVIKIFVLFLVLCSLFSVFAWPEVSSRWQISLTEQSITLRNLYNQTAFFIIKEHPVIGIGLGNFVAEMKEIFDLLGAWTLQPVHNLYLLIASELGLIGLIVFLMFVFQLTRQAKEQKAKNRQQYYLLLCLVSCFLFLGLFDHYFWTLQQGQILFWLVLGLLVSFENKSPRLY